MDDVFIRIGRENVFLSSLSKEEVVKIINQMTPSQKKEFFLTNLHKVHHIKAMFDEKTGRDAVVREKIEQMALEIYQESKGKNHE